VAGQRQRSPRSPASLAAWAPFGAKILINCYLWILAPCIQCYLIHLQSLTRAQPYRPPAASPLDAGAGNGPPCPSVAAHFAGGSC
jgi:hypothetical protein